MQTNAHTMGLQDGYSQEQWGPWKSHTLLMHQAIQELSWQDQAQTLSAAFKEHSREKDGYLSRDEFLGLMQKYICCKSSHPAVFFELFDRNQDGFLSENDFVGGIISVSPSTPHKLETSCGQLRMQFIFLYYDANRNGRLEVEEVAKMIEHIQQLRGQHNSDAMVDATALTSLYSGPFGFAAFHDSAQKRMLNGTSPLLRMQKDLAEVIREMQGIGHPQVSPTPSPAPRSSEDVLGTTGGYYGHSSLSAGAGGGPGAGPLLLSAGLNGCISAGGPDDLSSLASLPRGQVAPLGVSGHNATAAATAAGAATSVGSHAARPAAPPAQRSPYGSPPQQQQQQQQQHHQQLVQQHSQPMHPQPPQDFSWQWGCGIPSRSAGSTQNAGLGAQGVGSDVQALALRIVRQLMDLSNRDRTDWRCNLQLATSREVLLLCGTVVEIFRREDSLAEVSLPCRVYGDIHGQLLDLLEFFNAFSWPDKRRGDIFSMSYIFLGDFVDRGAYSVDVVTLLFSLKILYPKKVFLVRGNHEDRMMNVNYGFHDNCQRKFLAEGTDVWERMNDVFEFLPIAALVDTSILCIHGGIGDCISSLDDLRGIPKPIQVVGEINENTTRQDRVILDALWSDPTDNDEVLGIQSSPRGKNTCRFGPDRVQDFNRRNRLKLIIRAHECVQHGYEYFAAGQLLTVFSATNYCNQYNNDGAMVVLVKDDRTGEVLEHAQVIKSGQVDTSHGWNDQQFRAPSPMRRAEASGGEEFGDGAHRGW